MSKHFGNSMEKKNKFLTGKKSPEEADSVFTRLPQQIMRLNLLIAYA